MYFLSITIIILYGDFAKCSLQCKSNINEQNIHKLAKSGQFLALKICLICLGLSKLATLTMSRDCSHPWGINTLIFYSEKIADATLHHNTNKTSINEQTISSIVEM